MRKRPVLLLFDKVPRHKAIMSTLENSPRPVSDYVSTFVINNYTIRVMSMRQNNVYILKNKDEVAEKLGLLYRIQ